MASSSSDPTLKPEATTTTISAGAGTATGTGIGSGEMTEAAAGVIENEKLLLYRGLKKAKRERGCTAKERISKMPPCAAGKRSSIYRGVTRHRWTGRYEAHLWDKTTWNQNQNKKGKQVYLGAYDDEEAAARAYDLAALKYWGPGTLINFPVTDYTRDLEEMQNVSREDYLASLRRKSSGFSRGISKYRGISSRWESSFGRMAGSEYFNGLQHGDKSATDTDYIGSFCVERKVDLTNYIKWWSSNRSRQVDSVSKSSDDFGGELKALECEAHSSEPYQMPRLGLSHDGKQRKNSSVSAMSILARSSAFKNMQEKALKMKESIKERYEDENKNNINKMDYEKKIVEKTVYNEDGSDRLGIASEVEDGNFPSQSNLFPLMPFVSAPLLTNYGSIDSLTDPVQWPPVSLIPDLSRTLQEVTKTETSSTYTFFQQDE